MNYFSFCAQAAAVALVAGASGAGLSACGSMPAGTGNATVDAGSTKDLGAANTDGVVSDNGAALDTAAADLAQNLDSVTDLVASDVAACIENSTCSDGDPCTKNDKCIGGKCVGTPLVCDKDLPKCKVGKCEPNNGVCIISDKDGPCDDGDPCTQADNCIASVCIGFKIDGCCNKSCVGKVCGDDGCGGSCGKCKDTEVCGEGKCVVSSGPGETCAEAKPISALPFKDAGTTLGKKDDLNAPDKACYNGELGMYGPDVVYSYIPPADGTISVKISGYSNSPVFYVATDCADVKNSCLGGSGAFGLPDSFENFAKVKKGQKVYIVVDADQTEGGDFTIEVTNCPVNCKDKVCGYDGCGGDCGFCPKLSAYECSNIGTCLCVPKCDQKKCGDNGCGKSCGSCGGGDICDGGMQGAYKTGCVKDKQVGDTCSSAIPFDKSPFTYSGSTVGLGNNVYGWSFCEGDGTGAYYGAEAPDLIFSFGGKAAQTWFIDLSKYSTMLEIYAFGDCKDPISCKQAGYKGFNLKKWLFVESPTNAPLFVAVDGYDNQEGTFTLNATHCVQPGDCPNGDVGQYCSLPHIIAALPFKSAGQIGLDTYWLPKGVCGAKKDMGHGGGNTAYRITATKTGNYIATVTGNGGMDPILYMAGDCTQLATTCTALVDKTGENNTEILNFAMNAGDVRYLVVDATTKIGGNFSIDVVGP